MTRHFREDVVGPARHEKYEGITYERCVHIVHIIRERRYVEDSGEERLFWGYAPDTGRTKWLRVVTDGAEEVLITAYKDRTFARRVADDEQGRGGVR